MLGITHISLKFSSSEVVININFGVTIYQERRGKKANMDGGKDEWTKLHSGQLDPFFKGLPLYICIMKIENNV